MIRWRELDVSEHTLAWVAILLIAGLLIIAQAAYNEVNPPNHNDFIGLGDETTLLWLPWTLLAHTINAFSLLPTYVEIISFVSITAAFLGIFALSQELAGNDGGVSAATLFFLSPFAITAASIIPVPSLIGFALATWTTASAVLNTKTYGYETYILGFLLGFFPIYGLSLILASTLTSMFTWIGFDDESFFDHTAVYSIFPSLVMTAWYDWEILRSMAAMTFSVVSDTLPTGFALSVLLTWFGPVALLLAATAAYRSVYRPNMQTTLAVAVSVVGLSLYAQRIIDPLLVFPFFAIGLFTLCGVGVHDALNVAVKDRYELAIYVSILAVLLTALINTVSFTQAAVSSSRPSSTDLIGYQSLDVDKPTTLITPPREVPLAKYYTNSSVRGEWDVDSREGDAFRQILLTDLVELVGKNNSLVVSSWARKQYGDDFIEQLRNSDCFTTTYTQGQTFTVWRNSCSIQVSVTDAPR